MGDVKMLGMIGAFLGPSLMGLTLVLSSFAGALAGVAMLPGHEADAIEHVVERDERYLIVDKRDEVEHLVQ